MYRLKTSASLFITPPPQHPRVKIVATYTHFVLNLGHFRVTTELMTKSINNVGFHQVALKCTNIGIMYLETLADLLSGLPRHFRVADEQETRAVEHLESVVPALGVGCKYQHSFVL